MNMHPCGSRKESSFPVGGLRKVFSDNKQQSSSWNMAAMATEMVRAWVPLLLKYCTGSAKELCLDVAFQNVFS